MGRPPGVRNADYDATKEALAGRAFDALMHSGANVSLHELARATEVSIPTLKHYFGDRAGVVAEALRSARSRGARHLSELAEPGASALEPSLQKAATTIARAWVPFIGGMFTQGMAAGVFDAVIGPAYLEGVLEPTVLAMEARLRVHALRGEASLDGNDELEVRTAALAFLSPLLVAMIHQHGLSGAAYRPLDVERFVSTHVARFVRAYESATAPTRTRRSRP